MTKYKTIIIALALALVSGPIIAVGKKPVGVADANEKRQVIQSNLKAKNKEMLAANKEASECRKAAAGDEAAIAVCNQTASAKRKLIREEAREIASQLGELRRKPASAAEEATAEVAPESATGL